MVIYGQSLGGHLAPVVAAQKQNQFDALVIEGGFSSYKDMGADSFGFLGRMLVKQNYSGVESIQNCKNPTLVIHSIDDDEIPLKLGKKLYDAANQPKEFYEINECHICGPKFYSKEIAEKINEMLN